MITIKYNPKQLDPSDITNSLYSLTRVKEGATVDLTTGLAGSQAVNKMLLKMVEESGVTLGILDNDMKIPNLILHKTPIKVHYDKNLDTLEEGEELFEGYANSSYRITLSVEGEDKLILERDDTI